MIQEFIERFEANKDQARVALSGAHPSSYEALVKLAITLVTFPEDFGDGSRPDPERIHEIDDGDYQGTLLFVIAAKGYQPDDYWYVKVGYGSCSGCDTLESIRSYEDTPPSEQQVNDYMTLLLHIVQGLKKMD